MDSIDLNDQEIELSDYSNDTNLMNDQSRNNLNSYENNSETLEKILNKAKKRLHTKPATRIISSPYRNIEVSSFADDFYSNLLDWSREIIYYAIRNKIFAYNFHTETTVELFTSLHTITSLKYNKMTETLVVGSTAGVLYYLDTAEGGSREADSSFSLDSSFFSSRRNYSNRNEDSIRGSYLNNDYTCYPEDPNSSYSVSFTPTNLSSFETKNGILSKQGQKHLAHRSRIGVIKNYNHCIVTGSRDRKCKIVDLRTKNIVRTISTHSQEICGISLSDKLMATGGNDNKVFVFDLRSPMPLAKLNEHKAAVKALSWSPHSNFLITGGGSADKTMKVFDITQPEYLVKTINFSSQITNLKWLSDRQNGCTILSTFGYSEDDVKLLKDFKVKQKYKSHKNRVIHFSMSDDEKHFVTASGDGTIKFWEVNVNEEQEIRFR